MQENMPRYRDEMLEWADIMTNHSLPAWSDLPDLELYMDQVVSLVSQYLSHLGPMLGEDKPLTPAMINNYVKMGLLRPPVKKRYSRTHLACLVVICILKRSLTMAAIQKIMSKDITDEEARELYESFRRTRCAGIDFLAERVREWSGDLFLEDDAEDGSTLAMRLAVMANLLKISAEKLLGATDAELKPKKEKKEKKEKK